MWDFIIKYWLEFIFGLVTAGLVAGYSRLAKKFKAEKAKNQAIENGLRDILRIQILDIYEKCKSQQGGKISVSLKDAVDHAYQSYRALGGNGTIVQVHTEIMSMPII